MVSIDCSIANKTGPARASVRRLTGAFLAGVFLFSAPSLAQSDKAQSQEVSALAPGAIGQSDAKQPEEAIIVTAKPEPKPSEVQQQADAVSHTNVKYHTPLASFKDKVCPGIVGMPVSLAELMIDRIRSNAERVGIATASGTCRPNIMVIFVRNGQAVIKELDKKEPYVFRNLENYDVKDMIRDPGPVHAWVNKIVKSRQGDSLQGDNTGDLTQTPVLNVGQAQSHIFLAHRLDITNSVIMIDIPAIDGMSVVQIADYVSMRVFAETNPVKGDPAASTILTLFDKDAPHPHALTDFDLAFLRTVYSGADGLTAATKLASVSNKLRDIKVEKLKNGKPAN